MPPRPFACALLCLAAAPLPPPEPPPEPIPPDRAIALADDPGAPHAGRFAMVVAATGRAQGDLFLNSSADYRAADDLSFRLAPNVVAALARRFGQPPDTYLRGRRVVVDGTVRRQLIVRTEGAFPRYGQVDRWQHVVPVLFPRQVVAVADAPAGDAAGPPP